MLLYPTSAATSRKIVRSAAEHRRRLGDLLAACSVKPPIRRPISAPAVRGGPGRVLRSCPNAVRSPAGSDGRRGRRHRRSASPIVRTSSFGLFATRFRSRCDTPDRLTADRFLPSLRNGTDKQQAPKRPQSQGTFSFLPLPDTPPPGAPRGMGSGLARLHTVPRVRSRPEARPCHALASVAALRDCKTRPFAQEEGGKRGCFPFFRIPTSWLSTRVSVIHPPLFFPARRAILVSASGGGAASRGPTSATRLRAGGRSLPTTPIDPQSRAKLVESRHPPSEEGGPDPLLAGDVGDQADDHPLFDAKQLHVAPAQRHPARDPAGGEADPDLRRDPIRSDQLA